VSLSFAFSFLLLVSLSIIVCQIPPFNLLNPHSAFKTFTKFLGVSRFEAKIQATIVPHPTHPVNNENKAPHPNPDNAAFR
jgi:hypothetical protein